MHTFAKLLHRFALRNATIRRAVHQRATPALFRFRQRIDMAFFQHAHIQLAQARLKHDVTAAGVCDDARRLLCAT